MVASLLGCQGNPSATSSAMPARDINAVLQDHAGELMKLSGVVGVFAGLAKDQKTPCLRVMVIKATPELKRQIPKSLEGHPVVVEATGVIRPM